MIARQQLNDLTQTTGNNLVSIYIKTQRVANNEADRIRLKNAIKEANDQLQQHGIEDRDVEVYLKPVSDMVDNGTFWQNRSDGLAIFLSADGVKTFDLVGETSNKTYVGDQFVVSPLLGSISGEDRFFILSLSLNQIEFFEATRHSISPVIIEDLMPTSMHEKLAAEGATFPGNVQHHSGNGRGSTAIFHGHGDQDSTQEEAKEFFRLVDEGLLFMLHDERAPMILAGTTERVSLYREVSNYKFIVDEYVSGNMEEVDPVTLQNLAWEKIGGHFQQQRNQLNEDFGTYLSEDRASFSMLDIVPKAVNGRVENLLLDRDSETWGSFDQSTNTVEVHEERQSDSVLLEDLAARSVFDQGGTVYRIPREELIKPTSNMNATYRF